MKAGRELWAALLMAGLAMGGCAFKNVNTDDVLDDAFDDVRGWKDFGGRVASVGATYAAAAVLDAAIEAAQRPAPPILPASPTRLLQTVEGSVRDQEGQAIPGVTLSVRDTGKYTASPEQLPATTIHTSVNGAFALSMAKSDALCVDFAAEGKRPMRRWFVVDTFGVTASLPKDRSEILLVTPYAHVVRVVPTGLVMAPAP